MASSDVRILFPSSVSLSSSLLLCELHSQASSPIWGGTQNKLEFIYKKLYIYSYVFKLQSTSKYSPFDAIHPWRLFSHCSKQFLSLWILVPVVLLLFFLFVCLFHFFHISKIFPFEDFFHPGKQKRVAQGEIRWIGRVGHRRHAIFGQELRNTQHGVVGQVQL